MKKFVAFALLAIPVAVIFAQAAGADKIKTMSNLKQASVALLMYTADYDKWYPNAPTDSRLQNVLFPYLKTMKVWETMNPSGGTFTMNASIKGAKMTDIRNPAQTACLYETKTWPDGSRVVGFVDGHVKSISKDNWRAVEASLKTKVGKRAKPLPK